MSTSQVNSMPALRARPTLNGPAERGGRERHAAGDQVVELVVEVGEPEPDAVVPELLVDPDVPGEAVLRLQVRVAEAREEEVVEGRGPEAGAGAAAQAGARLLDQEGQRAALGGAWCRRRCCPPPGSRRSGRAARRSGAAARRTPTGSRWPARKVLRVLPDPRGGARARRCSCSTCRCGTVHPLRLPPLHVDLGEGGEVEVAAPGSTGSWKPGCSRSGRARPRLSHHSTGRRLALEAEDGASPTAAARSGSMMGLIGCGPGNDALHRHAGVVLVVAEDEVERRVAQGSVAPEAAADRVLVRCRRSGTGRCSRSASRTARSSGSSRPR